MTDQAIEPADVGRGYAAPIGTYTGGERLAVCCRCRYLLRNKTDDGVAWFQCGIAEGVHGNDAVGINPYRGACRLFEVQA